MIRHQFKGSSSIAGFRYNPETQQLDVTFASGRTYTLDGVPPDEVEKFQNADSPGSHWHSQLKGRY